MTSSTPPNAPPRSRRLRIRRAAWTRRAPSLTTPADVINERYFVAPQMRAAVVLSVDLTGVTHVTLSSMETADLYAMMCALQSEFHRRVIEEDGF